MLQISIDIGCDLWMFLNSKIIRNMEDMFFIHAEFQDKNQTPISVIGKDILDICTLDFYVQNIPPIFTEMYSSFSNI
jgi:hypothetical protein